MAIQTMGLDYSWLVNLADVISRARQKPTGGVTVSRPAQGTAAPEKTRYQIEKEQRREDLLAAQQRKHDVLLKQMDIDAKLAEAMSKERIASMGAKAGTEQAQIAGAAQIGAAQKTTMEKGYELLDMLWHMDEPSRNEFISRLEAKRAENQQVAGERPVSTITSGGRTITLPGSTEEPVKDPNDPLTALEEIGVYDSETGLSGPKLTGTAAKPEIEQLNDLIDDMLSDNIEYMKVFTTGEGWEELKEDDMLSDNIEYMKVFTTGEGWEELKERMITIGQESGFGEDVINSVVSMYEAIVPEPKPEPEPGPLSRAWSGVETTAANIAPFIRQALHPEERTPETEALARLWKEGAGRVGEPSEAIKSFAEMMERMVTGPFYPAYVKAVSKRKGEPVVKEPEAKEVEEVTEQDLITELGTWDEDTIKSFQTAAKKAGLYKGKVDGKISHALENAMKEYYKTHKEEWK